MYPFSAISTLLFGLSKVSEYFSRKKIEEKQEKLEDRIENRTDVMERDVERAMKRAYTLVEDAENLLRSSKDVLQSIKERGDKEREEMIKGFGDRIDEHVENLKDKTREPVESFEEFARKLDGMLPMGTKQFIIANAETMLRNGDIDGARRATDNLKKQYSDDPDVYFLDARVYFEEKKYDEAAENAKAAIDKGYSNEHAALGLLAHALEKSGKPDSAIGTLEKLAEKFPTDTNAIIELAKIYCYNNELDKAIKVYEKALNDGIINSRIYFWLCSCLLRRQTPTDLDNVNRIITDAIEKFPANKILAQIKIRRLLILKRKKEVEGAFVGYDGTLTLEEKANFYYNLAHDCWSDKTDESKEFAKWLLKMATNIEIPNERAIASLGIFLFLEEYYDELDGVLSEWELNTGIDHNWKPLLVFCRKLADTEATPDVIRGVEKDLLQQRKWSVEKGLEVWDYTGDKDYKALEEKIVSILRDLQASPKYIANLQKFLRGEFENLNEYIQYPGY